MPSHNFLLKLKIHLGDLTAVTLLPLSEMTIESVLEIAALEFPDQFSAAASSSEVLSLFSFGSSGQRFSEISTTPLLRSLFHNSESARVYLFAPNRLHAPPPLPPQNKFVSKKARESWDEDTVRLKLVKGEDLRCV
jgi:hypothetical protein